MSKRPPNSEQTNNAKKSSPSIQYQLKDAVQRFHFFTNEADKASKDILHYSKLLSSNNAESKLMAALSTPLAANGTEVVDLNLSSSTPSMNVLGFNIPSISPAVNNSQRASVQSGLTRNAQIPIQSRQQLIGKQSKLTNPVQLGSTAKSTNPNTILDSTPKPVKVATQTSGLSKSLPQPESTKSRSSNSSLPIITTSITNQIPSELQPRCIPVHFVTESQNIPTTRSISTAQIVSTVFAEIKSKASFPIETLPKRCNLTNVKFDRKGGLLRKPRDALFNRWTPEFKDLLVTSSLDGNIHLWNAKERRIKKQITKDQLSSRWVECLCWATPRTLLGSASLTTTDEHEPQLFLINVQQDYNYSVTKIPKVNHPKGISAIASILTAHSANPTNNFSFLSAGLEKQIFWWNIREEQTKVYSLHSKHTANVHALMYTNSLVYSGGADSQVFGWDVTKQECIADIRFEGRVNCLTENPRDPYLYLVTTSMRSQQLKLCDQRLNPQQVLSFGWEQEVNLNQYIAPSFHSNGYLVACGSESPANPYIRVWDLRYVKVSAEHQNVLCHEKKINRTVFHPTENYMVSLSDDRDTVFIDFQL